MGINPWSGSKIRLLVSLGLLFGLVFLPGSSVLAQSRSFFDTQARPDRLSTCTDESCWAAALAACSPALRQLAHRYIEFCFRGCSKPHAVRANQALSKL